MRDSDKKRKELYNKFQEILLRENRLEPEEYLELLYTIQKNYLCTLAGESLRGEVRGSNAMMFVIEKCHYLIESMVGKELELGDIEIGYDLQLPIDDKKTLHA
jgi:hypothetical protein